MVKLKSLDRSSSSRPWFGKQDKSQMQQLLQEKDATIEALQARISRDMRENNAHSCMHFHVLCMHKT